MKGTDAAISTLARRQHGVVTRTQLLGAGLGREAIANRVKARWLRPVHRGVYMVGPVQAPNAREMAAVLVCGSGAVLSHRSAARLWELLPDPGGDPAIDVTVPAGRHRRRAGVRVHRVGSLPRDERTKLKGIPVTTPARTLLDLAAEVTLRELEQAVAQAVRRRLVSRAKLRSLLARHPRCPGAPALRALVEREEVAFTRSHAEERFLDLIRKARLPAPDVNARLGPYEVDFLWRAERLAVEVDGFSFHSGPLGVRARPPS